MYGGLKQIYHRLNMKNNDLAQFRQTLRAKAYISEDQVLGELMAGSAMTSNEKAQAQTTAMELVTRLRNDDETGLMEVFLAEYGLSTDEGVALMCLAEALLRVPDSDTMDDLIEDKLVSSAWGEHLGQSSSSLVNAATWGLLFTGKVLDDTQENSIASTLRGAIKRLGEPVVRNAVRQSIKVMGQQFVLGESMESAQERGSHMMARGYTYSFDMLGEAALTIKDAAKYFKSYENAIAQIASFNNDEDTKPLEAKPVKTKPVDKSVVENSGISIKLSALHPRYEVGQQQRVVDELVPTVLALAQQAKQANIGFNIDAEEADRLDLSLDVIQGVFEHPSLAGWDGFGVVVQAYNRRASYVLDWVHALAEKNARRIMVRLVKGAYWDSEIKRAQVEGLKDYPVFTRKAATDISYLCCAKKLLSMGSLIYSQFATHNAHTIAAVLAIAENNAKESSDYEFQRLHGMGERVYDLLREQRPVPCRIYAPVGKHRDLLAYLVRRLLENGANSSFVNQIVDLDTPLEQLVADPFNASLTKAPSFIRPPSELFHPERINSRGWDLHDYMDIKEYEAAREPFITKQWHATPLTAESLNGEPFSAESLNERNVVEVTNPADHSDTVGDVTHASESDVTLAIESAKPWQDADTDQRSETLQAVASLYEENAGELFAILTREAGKTPLDAVAEIREAVDFLRYYSAQAKVHAARNARGVFSCISPWNFPLAIFTGQICAALAAGNAVLAKPADVTALVAFFAVTLFHQAGVPRNTLQLLPGRGSKVGSQMVSAPQVNGVCFTGSTVTGLRINRSMAENVNPNAPLIAETGGLNAMIVDSTALPEQVVADIIRSAFQSAGQRCSALRLLYLQEDVYDNVLEMLLGATDELSIGNPWDFSTDVGPLISEQARQSIQSYIDTAAGEGRLIKQITDAVPTSGHFVGPAVIKVNGIKDMETEVFGPVLHIASFDSDSLGQLVTDLNDSGYGLTFGLHTRIDDRVEYLVERLNVGNMYVNRDQIGAVVGSQPFGGEDLSGTGPKAGGPSYLLRFLSAESSTNSEKSHSEQSQSNNNDQSDSIVSVQQAQETLNSITAAVGLNRIKLNEHEMPGPTGESNVLYEYARGLILCLGSDLAAANQQAEIAQKNSCSTLVICPGAKGENTIDGFLPREHLTELHGFSAVALFGKDEDLTLARRALANRDGKIIPLACDSSLNEYCRLERHVCVDTTASGGNASLLAAAAELS